MNNNNLFENTRLNGRLDVAIELIDVDLVVKNYIEANITTPFTDHSGTAVNDIKVEFKNPERWAKMFYGNMDNDQSGEMIELPVVIINRSNVNILKDRTPHWLPDEVLEYIVTAQSKPTYLPNGNVSYKISRKPVSIQGTYDITIVSKFKSHADVIAQRFIMNEGKFWGSDGYGIKASYSDISDSTNPISITEERLIRYSLTATVDGYILPNNNGKDEIVLKTIPAIAKIQVSESEISFEEFRDKYNI